MAESAVSFLLNKLAALHHNEVKLLGGVWQDVRYIRDELEQMRAFLKEADAAQERNEEIKVWVKQVREAVYDTEDVLDKFQLHVVSHQRNRGFWCFLKYFQYIFTRHHVATKMKDIKARIMDIAERHRRYCCVSRSNSTQERPTTSYNLNRRWSGCRGDALLIQETELVGITRHKDQLIQWLLEDDPPGQRVISVVGMGGMGKTALIKKVYDDAKVIKNFQTRAWITIAESPIVEEQEILKNIISQLFVGISDRVQGMDINSMKMKISNFLSQNRYVIVLDDIWSLEAWGSLKYAFPSCESGSRVILTTRNDEIASVACSQRSDRKYYLKPLSEEESLILFCRKAFREDSCPQHLNDICHRILRRCKGLPLAIVAIGGLLSTKNAGRIDEWNMVESSLSAHIEENSQLDSMKRILSLSYDDLPSHLKACFLYLSIYPENRLIKRMKLIRLWMAEGLVERKEGQLPEEVAESYLKELVDRSLVQIATTTRNGRVSTCRVHDLLHKIAISKSREQNFVTIATQNNVLSHEKIRRLSIQKTPGNIEQRKRVSQLRSLFVFGGVNLPSISSILHCARLLKVLDLQGSRLEIFPEEISKLYLLRYLSLRATRVKQIPRSIGRLIYLETLDLKHASVSELPPEILNLRRLRHLLVYRYEKRSSSAFHSTYGFRAPTAIGGLSSLQKLCFIEANESSNVLTEIGRLTQLRRLGITKLRREDGPALSSTIENLKNLRSLDISSINEDEFVDIQHLSTPPPYLQRLWLQGRLEELPPWISSMQCLVKLRLRWSHLTHDPLNSLQGLINLVELQLRSAYNGDALHFRAGGLPGLKVLHLHDLEQLRRVLVEDGAMPHLEELNIINCKSLEKVPHGIDFLKELKSVSFADMDNEMIRSLQSKQGDDYSKIKNIAEVYYTFQENGKWKKLRL